MNFAARNASSSTAPAAAVTGGSFSMGRRTLGVGLAATILAAGAYAYTAGNTIEDAGHAGDGSGTISGYVVTGVQYTLDAADPSTIASVSFTLDAPATNVKATTDNNAGGYANCTNSAGTDWTCDFTTPPGVEGATSLSVVAAD